MAATDQRGRQFQRKLTPMQAAALAADVARGMTRVDAAEKYGVSRRTVHRILTDEYGPKRQLDPCGTNAAYRRHLRRREPPCLPCSAAHTAYEREWSERRRAG